MRQQRRKVSAGASRDPPPERRELEGLRKVPQGEPVLAELRLEPGTRRARLDPRGTGRRVELEHSVEALEVDRDDTRIAVRHARLDPTNHAGPAPERDDRSTGVDCPREYGLDVRS